VTNFIKAALNETRKANGLEDMPAKEMLAEIRENLNFWELKKIFLLVLLMKVFLEEKRNVTKSSK
jgi:Fe-S cluster assembly ATP-binding protein